MGTFWNRTKEMLIMYDAHLHRRLVLHIRKVLPKHPRNERSVVGIGTRTRIKFSHSLDELWSSFILICPQCIHFFQINWILDALQVDTCWKTSRVYPKKNVIWFLLFLVNMNNLVEILWNYLTSSCKAFSMRKRYNRNSSNSGIGTPIWLMVSRTVEKISCRIPPNA